MHAFDEMAKVESGIRVSSMLLFVIVSCISLSNCADAGDKQSSVGSLFKNGTLTEKQKNSTVTIEFNCTGIDTKKNRTAVESIYRNVHREILKSLDSTKSDMTTVAFITSFVATIPTSTTLTPVETTITTTVTTTATTAMPEPDLSKRKKRKKRQQTSDDDPIEAKDLRFVQTDPETDDNVILRMSLLLVLKESDDRDCGIILLEAANQTINDGTLASVAGVPVVTIYRGLPADRRAVTMPMQNYNHHYLIWPLVILCVIVLFIVIGVLIYRKKQQDKLEITSANEII